MICGRPQFNKSWRSSDPGWPLLEEMSDMSWTETQKTTVNVVSPKASSCLCSFNLQKFKLAPNFTQLTIQAIEAGDSCAIWAIWWDYSGYFIFPTLLRFILWNNLCSKSSPYRNSSKVKAGVSCPVLKHWKTNVQRKRLLEPSPLGCIYILNDSTFTWSNVQNGWFWKKHNQKKLNLHHPTVDERNPLNQLIW